jgi:hypothetical protein
MEGSEMQAGMAGKHMGRAFWGPRIAMFAVTRVALGIGVGLMISRKLSKEEAKAAGTALIAMGALTTVPFLVGFARSRGDEHGEGCRCPMCRAESQAAQTAEPQSA